MFWKRIWNGVESLIWPARCAGCRVRVFAEGGELGNRIFCSDCEQTLIPVSSPLCPRCGLPYDGRGSDHLCGECLATPLVFDKLAAAYRYGGAIADALKGLKYGRKTHLARPLGQMMIPVTERLPAPDLIVPVPLHARKLRARGFNQSALLGAVVESALRVRMDTGTILRVRPTRPQAGQSREERIANIRGAFQITHARRVQGKRILVVDDVVTTGTTVREVARVLRRSGACAVYAVAVARACQT